MKKVWPFILVIAMSSTFASEFAFNQKDSKLDFGIYKYKLLTTIAGNFSDFSGTVNVDGDRLSELTGSVKASSIDTGIEKRNKHLRSADFFNEDQYPVMTFTQTSPVVFKENQEVMIPGTLSIKDVTKEVELKALVKKVDRKKVGIIFKTMINRYDYNINFNLKMKTRIGESKKTFERIATEFINNYVIDNRVEIKADVIAELVK